MRGQIKKTLEDYRDAASPPDDAQDRLWDRISDSIDAGAALPPDVGPMSEAVGGAASSSGGAWGGGISWTVATVSVVGATAVLVTSSPDSTTDSPPDSTTETPTREPPEATVVLPPTPVPREAPIPEPSRQPSPSVPTSRPSPESAGRREPRRETRPVVPAATPISTGLSAELAIIRKAEASLAAGNWRAALKHLASHGRQFPEAQLEQERAALRVRALCAAGKRPQARGEAHVFLRRWPTSTHADQIRGLCREPSSQKPSGVGTAG